MCAPASVVLRDQCEMEGSKKREPQKKARGQGVPEGVRQVGAGGVSPDHAGA